MTRPKGTKNKRKPAQPKEGPSLFKKASKAPIQKVQEENKVVSILQSPMGYVEKYFTLALYYQGYPI